MHINPRHLQTSMGKGRVFVDGEMVVCGGDGFLKKLVIDYVQRSHVPDLNFVTETPYSHVTKQQAHYAVGPEGVLLWMEDRAPETRSFTHGISAAERSGLFMSSREIARYNTFELFSRMVLVPEGNWQVRNGVVNYCSPEHTLERAVEFVPDQSEMEESFRKSNGDMLELIEKAQVRIRVDVMMGFFYRSRTN
jgi:hypothetical protein